MQGLPYKSSSCPNISLQGLKKKKEPGTKTLALLLPRGLLVFLREKLTRMWDFHQWGATRLFQGRGAFRHLGCVPPLQGSPFDAMLHAEKT